MRPTLGLLDFCTAISSAPPRIRTKNAKRMSIYLIDSSIEALTYAENDKEDPTRLAPKAMSEREDYRGADDKGVNDNERDTNVAALIQTSHSSERAPRVGIEDAGSVNWRRPGAGAGRGGGRREEYLVVRSRPNEALYEENRACCGNTNCDFHSGIGRKASPRTVRDGTRRHVYGADILFSISIFGYHHFCCAATLQCGRSVVEI